MPAIDMKEVRIPSALMRERRPSILFTMVKATFAALVVGVGSFFVLNVLAITALGVVGAVQHKVLDFSIAYRDFAAPAALGIFILAWAGSLTFFFRERNR
jgi:hypothetical protein